MAIILFHSSILFLLVLLPPSTLTAVTIDTCWGNERKIHGRSGGKGKVLWSTRLADWWPHSLLLDTDMGSRGPFSRPPSIQTAKQAHLCCCCRCCRGGSKRSGDDCITSTSSSPLISSPPPPPPFSQGGGRSFPYIHRRPKPNSTSTTTLPPPSSRALGPALYPLHITPTTTHATGASRESRIMLHHQAAVVRRRGGC